MFKKLKDIDLDTVNGWSKLTQSYVFYKYSDTKSSPAKLTVALYSDHRNKDLQQAAKFYPELQGFLLELIDHQHAITTRKQYSDHFPTGVGLIRIKHNNAGKISPQHNLFYLLNMLLRSICMVRTIDYALTQLIESQPQLDQHLTSQREKLKNHFSELLGRSISLQTQLTETDGSDRVDNLTRWFNSKLFESIQGTGLDYGVREGEVKDYSKRLDYFRFLSGLLDPAQSCVTVFEVKSLTSVIISHPVTVKTEEQMTSIKAWDFNEPLRILNDIFKPLLLKNDRCCSAQLRNYIPYTVKNAFIVNTEIFLQQQLIASDWILRSGSISYVGPCDDPSIRVTSAEQNLDQLRQYSLHFTNKPNIHASILVTKSIAGKQRVIINTANEAIQNKRDYASYSPVNVEGCFHPLSTDPDIIQTSDDSPYRFPTPCARTYRAFAAATIIEIAKQYPGIIALLFCASGQDRTGVIITTVQILTILNYGNQHHLNLTFEEVAQAYVLARDTQVMASLLCLGAEGIKSSSNPSGLFTELVCAYLFLKTAHRNKNALVHSTQSVKFSRQSLLLCCKQEIIRRFSDFVKERSKLLNGLSVFHSYELSATKLNLAQQFLITISSKPLEAFPGIIQTLIENNGRAVEDKKSSSSLFSRITKGSLHTIATESKELVLDCPTLN